MNLKAMSIYIGHLLVMEGISMLPAVAIAGYNGERNALFGFAATILLLFLLGLPLSVQRKERSVHAREGFATVGLGWILISLFGALPFYISGGIPHFIDAVFETVSGFTTTGATILSDVESMARSLLYWRSFTHWLGGMGVLVLILAISSFSKGNGETFHLLRAESPGPSVGKLTPTIRQTARMLYLIYLVLTLLQTGLLMLGGMPFFDSLTNAFSTAGTGGFSIKNLSIEAYNSDYVELVIAIFMFIFGINFTVFYMLLLRQVKAVYRNEELRAYILLVVVCTLILAIDIQNIYPHLPEALLKSFFQVASIISTTGFSTADFNLWPMLARFMIILMMWIGACAGSTAGGVKVSRLLLLWKSLKCHMQIMLRPRAIRPVQVEGRTVSREVVSGVHAYLTAYVLIVFISIFLVTMDNYNLETNVSAVITCISNTGPGLDMVGPRGNFGFFSDFSKLIFSADMLLGRLEIFPMLLLFMPATWRKQA